MRGWGIRQLLLRFVVPLGFRTCGAIVVNVCVCIAASAFPYVDLVDAF